MSGKNQFPTILNWQSTNPQTGFLPLNAKTAGIGSVPSGVLTGTMSGTNTIYSNIIDISRMDNCGLEIAWTGTPAGTFTYLCSNSGATFFSITFTATQPSGTQGSFGANLNQLPYKYFMIQYTNTTGTGVLSAVAQYKDLN